MVDQTFFGVAARLMRQVLVDYARIHGADKRGLSGRCSRWRCGWWESRLRRWWGSGLGRTGSRG
jgi:hypothetical protein